MRHGQPTISILPIIFLAKLKADVVQPFNPPFYDGYVDDDVVWSSALSPQHKHSTSVGSSKGLIMIQQLRPSLNKQVFSYVSKLFPSGIT